MLFFDEQIIPTKSKSRSFVDAIVVLVSKHPLTYDHNYDRNIFVACRKWLRVNKPIKLEDLLLSTNH